MGGGITCFGYMYLPSYVGCTHVAESGYMIDYFLGPDPYDILGRKRVRGVESTYKSKN